MTPVVIVGGGDAKLYALNADTGKPIWSVALGTPPATFLYSPPTVFNGSVYIGVSAAEDCLHIPGAVVGPAGCRDRRHATYVQRGANGLSGRQHLVLADD
jgi:hypothetical protein